jgi:hypothetical protein
MTCKPTPESAVGVAILAHTLIGSGFGGFLLYIPSEEPEGGGDCASQAPVGS